MAGKKGRSGRKVQHKKEPQAIAAPEGAPTMPRWLGPRAKTVWKATIKDLNSMKPNPLTIVDGRFLAMYCEAWQDYFDAKATIKKEGAELGTPQGIKAHPACKRMNDAIARIDKFGSKFGLSPVDRSALKIKDHGDRMGEKKETVAGMLQSRAKGLRVVS